MHRQAAGGKAVAICCFCRNNYSTKEGCQPQPKPYPVDSVAMRLTVLPLEDSLELRQAAHQLAEDFSRMLPAGTSPSGSYDAESGRRKFNWCATPSVSTV